MSDEIEGFYSTYKVLKPLCFLREYHSNPDFVENIHKEKLLHSCIVNGAFAAELSLKAIYFKENEKLDIKGHYLYKLLNNIPQIHQNEIIEQISQKNKINCEQTLSLIEQLGDPFCEWRYAYESLLGYGIFFSCFVETVCKFFFDLYDIETSDLVTDIMLGE